MNGTPAEQTQSADGTAIAFERVGAGPALILIGGALSDRMGAVPLADRLASSFTVYCYDRRGRGSSGDTPPYRVEREIEDLAAVIGAAGGSARVYGHSSGAVLGLEAAMGGLPITRLAVYEPPYILDGDRSVPAADLAARIGDLVSSGRPGAAVKAFMVEAVGMPPEVLDGMAASPVWASMEALAPTLPYDIAVVGGGNVMPTERLFAIRIPTLALSGGASPDWARNSVAALASTIPGARLVDLEGQTHGADIKVLAPVLEDFFS
jgi:pimeloyl-ACP methyl ester carboxylesterase